MYNFTKIEKKWQNRWEENSTFHVIEDDKKEKFYALVEFPYPSGQGLHVGHVKAYTGLEVLSRKRRMEGYNVLFPIGFDAFGLPTENYAIKNNIHPKIVTENNIIKFTEQIKRIGYSFDYSRVINTSDENYYKWTQWIFLKMFEKGLVFRNKTYVNYCPSCKVVLSNEDSQGGKCDICHNDVMQKEKDVWYLKITEYADKLLEGLDEIESSLSIKVQQENWIGKSKGAYVDFDVDQDKLKVYTTRPDTLFGVTFMVLAPEHPIIEKSKEKIKNISEVNSYKDLTNKKTEFERMNLNKEKSGVKLDGLTAINPVNNKEIPIYISDYVMMNYGTGAIMAVPAHDQRDYDFAKKFNIDIVQVISGGNIEKAAHEEDGVVINSEFLNGLNKNEAINKVLTYLKENNIGEEGTQYKIKDWAFNRQRYWGEPIPIIHCSNCGYVPVPYSELPVKLPDIDNFEPGKNGESPLASIPSFVNCKCPKCNRDAKRETDTMPQWAGSSWYYLRYIDPNNDKVLADFSKLNYWLKVDCYNGGMEHVTRHLIYSRFWHRFLYDIGVVSTKEPYKKRTNQGLILGSDGEKMSKSRGNVVDPMEIIDGYGADTLRLFLLFLGEYSVESSWNDDSIKGISRFLDKVYNLKDKVNNDVEYSSDLEIKINKTIKKVSEDIEAMKYNTAISELMILSNEYSNKNNITKKDYVTLLKLLNPFAPHITEELNEIIGNEELAYSKWPLTDNSKLSDETYEMIIQINGKVRGKEIVKLNTSKEDMEAIAKENENIKKYINDKKIVKIIIIQNKIVNIVISE